MSHARSRYLLTLVGALAMMMVLAGCKHKPAPAPPTPPPPPAPAPTVTLNANPDTIQAGQSATLTWTSSNAQQVQLNGSTVDNNGSETVSPAQTTTYEIVATGSNNQTANASATVTVTPAPAPPAPTPQPTVESLADRFKQNVGDIYFAFNKSNISPTAQETLQQDATWLNAHPSVNILIAGHCDERGSAEYNMGLGDRRANAGRSYLIQLGVAANRIQTISYGKERPFCTEHTPSCWQSNRRDHITMAANGNQ